MEDFVCHLIAIVDIMEYFVGHGLQLLQSFTLYVLIVLCRW